MSTCQKFGLKWYFRALAEKGGLFSEYLRSEIYPPNIIIAYDRPTDDKPLKMFRVFEDHGELLEMLDTVPCSQQHFFEIILGERQQKPKFDIDFPGNDTETGLRILNGLISTLRKARIPRSDINIYGSCSEAKQSYHLVIDRMCQNADAAKAFHRWCVAEMNKDPELQNLTTYIDPNVYSSFQNFRLLWSCKKPGKPCKMPIEPETNEPELLLQRSLVSYADGCQELRVNYNPKPIIVRETLDIDDDLLEEVEECFEDVCFEQNGFVHAEVATVKGDLILMKRLQPSWCWICNRIHDNDNPFITVRKHDGFITASYYCRRNEYNKKYQLFSRKEDSDHTTEGGKVTEMDEYDYRALILAGAKKPREETKRMILAKETPEDIERKRILSLRMTPKQIHKFIS